MPRSSINLAGRVRTKGPATRLLYGACCVCAVSAPALAAPESIDVIAEHLPEAAMDNRYASLPLWARADELHGSQWLAAVGVAYARSRARGLSLEGPMLALSATKRLEQEWSITAFAFFDDLRFSGGSARLPLEAQFTSATPLTLPVDAQFSDLRGKARDLGAGLGVRRAAHWQPWGSFEWAAGLLWQRVSLRDFTVRYRVLGGAQAGTEGTLDYSTTYNHLTPYVGLAWPRVYSQWTSTPHVQLALPLPRRGVQGRITGPGFDVRGNAAGNGYGKHFGDPSLTVGWDLTYRPWRATFDVGSVLTQALFERPNHEGVERNWLLSARWEF
jgi:hypothetical protein